MLGFSTYAALLPELRDLWGLSNSEAGLIGGMFFAGYIGTVSLWTALTDRMDARRVYIAGCLLAAAASAGFGLVAGGVVNLETDVPRVAVSSGRCVLLRDAGVGRDGPIQKLLWERAQQIADDGGKQGDRSQDGIAEKDVRARRPRPGFRGHQGDDRDGGNAEEQRPTHDAVRPTSHVVRRRAAVKPPASCAAAGSPCADP